MASGAGSDAQDSGIRWRLNPHLRFYPFDSRNTAEWLVELDDPAGRTHRMVISSALHEGLQHLHDPTALGTLDARLAADGWSPEAVQSLLRSLEGECRARHLIVEEHSGAKPALKQRAKPRYMAAMIPLIPAWVVNPLARVLSPLFSRTGIVLGMLCGGLGLWLMFQAMGDLGPFDTPRAEDILQALALGASVLLLHELGHAAAAWREGARKVSIGAGWYAVFPVAYADLSEVWRLPAHRRITVNLAGVFMQGLALLLLMLAYRVFGNLVFLATAVATSASMLWNLNPLMRLDGYWVVSDLLRTTDLRGEATRALREGWNRIRRGKLAPAQTSQASLPPAIAWLLAAYALACTLFFALVVVAALARFSEAIAGLFQAWIDGWLEMAWSSGSWAEATVLVGATAWKLVAAWFIGRFLLSTFASFSRWAGARVRALRGTATTSARPGT